MMKRTFKTFAILLALSAVLTLIVACEENEPTYSDYSITVVDGMGDPISEVIVKFIDANGEIKTRVTDKDGSAVLKNTLDGNYKVFVEQGFSDAIITQNEYALSENNKSLKIVVRNGSKTMDVYGDVSDDAYAYNVGIGNYNVVAEAGKTTYFVFNAQIKGVYKVTFNSSDAEMTVGYYGIPMFVQSTHRGEGEYDGKSFELIIHDAQTPYVIGLNCVNSCEAELTIERTGDAPFDPNYAPWTTIPSTAELEKLTLPAGAVLSDIDVTDPTVSVSLGDDGCYYTADGKPVYIRIGSVCTAGYLDVSIAYIAGLVDRNIGQNFGGYVYDENGDFVGKYSYNEMLKTYYGYTDEKNVFHPGYCDSNGVYLLTEELAEAIKCHGNSAGWWKPNTVNYLFNGVNVVPENAWLFLCCTVN